jgi:D-lyxose ketol-isomerase
MISTESEVSATTPTSVDRVAHAYCARCNPEPQPGEPITALCGATHPFWGRRDRPVSICPTCHALAYAVVYPCGHSAQSM